MARYITRKVFVTVTVAAVIVIVAVIIDSQSPAPQPPSLLVKKVRPAYSGDKTHGLASVCLSNGNKTAVVFQPGFTNDGFAWMYLWFGVEKKQAGRWSLESVAPSAVAPSVMVASNRTTVASFNLWSAGQTFDLQVRVPADDLPRRFVMRWKPAPRNLPAPLASMRQIWNNFMPFESSYTELRSAEIAVEKLSNYDYESAFKRLDGGEFKPGQISMTRFEGFGVGYSKGRGASQILSHEKESP